MEQSKLTAVEWLENQIRYYISNDNRLFEIFKQAKELEKQQIIEAYYEGKEYGFKEKGEEYYNETFKQKPEAEKV